MRAFHLLDCLLQQSLWQAYIIDIHFAHYIAFLLFSSDKSYYPVHRAVF
jgi:hypothetical protein